MTDKKIPESAALWWVENIVGVRTIARVVVDQADGEPYLGYLPFELLPCGDETAIPVADFPGTWLAPVMLREEVERLQAGESRRAELSSEAKAKIVGIDNAIGDDTEHAHPELDRVLCWLLNELGFEDVVSLYEDQPRWFS